ncbi:LRR receptor-like serine threonine-protein kinase At4g08850-like [Seminavis robusta]|uniref:LRR receptor-like serine threonine-protein kinase At4g08850-like n=1 Tax=Seminavis robusta TaxID=568900 RepID=A0A9N8DVD1_9STRA|nr:LRR receptor-like serine threonine-protein kinase At4g08850-like [Seminavis robusta]|eukprot:Sro304_g112530.1 LRR receptor-like serine threonine-protein kinase At4g08850-like (571) ;mRNA; r:10921-12782
MSSTNSSNNKDDEDDDSEFDLDDELADLSELGLEDDEEELATAPKKGFTKMNNSSHSSDRFRRVSAAPVPARKSSSSGSVAKLWKARGKQGTVDQSINLMSVSHHHRESDALAKSQNSMNWGQRSLTDIFLDRDSMNGSSRSSIHYGDNDSPKNGKAKLKKWPVFVILMLTVLIVVILMITVPTGGVIASPSKQPEPPKENNTPVPVPQEEESPQPQEEEEETIEELTEEEVMQPNSQQQAELENLKEETERLNVVNAMLAQAGIPPNENTAANKAVHWIAVEDPAQLPLDSNHAQLLQRYTLALFYHSQHILADDQKKSAERAGVGGRRQLLEQKQNTDLTNRAFFDKAWMTPHHVCQWHGVVCDTTTNKIVQELQLERTLLQGTIPRELFVTMPSLTGIDLMHNQLHGSVPSTTTKNLTKLEFLLLGNNQLTGSLPRNLLQDLPTLKELVLAGNKLTGELPQPPPNNNKLRILSLASNHLVGSIPTSYGEQLGGLQKLHLDGNSGLKGAVPSELGLLPNLERLQLDGTSLSGDMPAEVCALRQTSRLKYLVADCTTGKIQCDCCSDCY